VDDDGRPLVVDYLASLERGGYVYTVRYHHAPADFTVRWDSEASAGLRRVIGTAAFVPAGEHACDLLYETLVEVAADLPAWALASQEDRPAEQLCEAFRAWVERRAEPRAL
jgi:hypothetical protein